MTLAVPYEHVRDVCKIGQGSDCCRYIFIGPDSWGCAKVVAHLKQRLDAQVDREEMTAIGDNCPGWPSEKEE